MEGDRQRESENHRKTAGYFNPLPPHGGRPRYTVTYCQYGDISIHSLRMEGDCCICPQNAGMVYFNPLPPHGGRLSKDKNSPAYDPFQSTPSAWRETPAPVQVSPWAFYFNPLPPHGGRLHNSNVLFRARNISIHSLRMEGDMKLSPNLIYLYEFQSTPSAWRETLESLKLM